MENRVIALDNMPVGLRFRPTDEELVAYYLKHKLLDDDFPIHIIPEIDLRRVEPWDVPDLSIIKSDDPEWFFFSPVDYKYSNSKKVNRITKCGFWKSTGTDRSIKLRGTNDLIGTKKTLVYYKGRVPNAVKSNWVIHEYQAVTTIHQSQTCFVLCHLKNKAGKGGNDASICDEGEPSTSGHMGSSLHEIMATDEGIPPVGALPEMNTGTIFQSMHQKEIDFPPMQQFSIDIEQEASFTSFPAHSIMQPFETTKEGNEFPTSILPPIQSLVGIQQEASFTSSQAHNAYFENEDNVMQTPPDETTKGGNESLTSIFSSLEIIKEEKEFLKSIFADENIEESGHDFVNSSTQSESLKRVHCESNDTDVEVASALNGNIVDTSAMCNEHPSSGEYHVSKRLKSTRGTIDGGIHLVSFDQEANKEERSIQNDFCRVETSSCDSTTNKPLEADCFEISCLPSTLKRQKNKHHQRPSNFISQKTTARRSRIQRKASSNAVSHLEIEKELAIVES